MKQQQHTAEFGHEIRQTSKMYGYMKQQESFAKQTNRGLIILNKYGDQIMCNSVLKLNMLSAIYVTELLLSCFCYPACSTGSVS